MEIVEKTIFPPLIFPVLKKWKNWTVFQATAHFLQLYGGKNVAIFSIFSSPTGKINFAPFFPPKASPHLGHGRGRLRDLISPAWRRTSSSVGFRHYSQGARAILLLFSVNPRHEQTIAQNTFAHSPIVAVSTVAIPITPINRHPNATPAA